MTKLSAVIITQDEEKDIKRCLESAKFANEIIVVDSGSTDDTLSIAKKYHAKIFYREFDDYSSQRNFALSKATGEWVLSLDADEEVSKDLAAEIIQEIESPKYDGFLIPRKNIIFGEEIRHTRWAPDKHVWLFKKAKGRFVNSIHEEVEITGEIGELKNAKIHHSHENIASFIDMLNSYTEKEASELFRKQVRFNFLSLIVSTKKSFIGRFIFKSGFKDGWRGFVLSYLRSMYKFATWVKVWEREQN